jgi:hypothetical protein
MPLVKDTEKFGRLWNNWWKLMQPSWRLGGDDALSRNVPPNANWSHLRCGGPNGLVIVILALAWWMRGVSIGDSSGLTFVQEAIEEVNWTLVQMQANVIGDKTDCKKRQAENSDLTPAKRWVHNIRY